MRSGTAALFMMAAVYVLMAWQVVFVEKLGPIVGTIDASAGRGVHAGDALAVPLVALAALSAGGGIGLLRLATERGRLGAALAHR